MTIIELAGPAGSGKSTLTTALREHDKKIQLAFFPEFRNLGNIPFFIWNAGLSLPALYALYRGKKNRSLAAQELLTMAILRGWSNKLKKINRANGNVILLDQGPVYMMTELLCRHGIEDFRYSTSNWWEWVSGDWANVMDIVVCLDTSDSTLIERVRARNKSNQIKRNTDEWAVNSLARSRMALCEVLKSMKGKNSSLKVIHIETSQTSLINAVQTIYAFLCL